MHELVIIQTQWRKIYRLSMGISPGIIHVYFINLVNVVKRRAIDAVYVRKYDSQIGAAVAWYTLLFPARYG